MIDPRTEYVDVTPAQAEEWLGHNTRNRHLRKPVVAQYARDMLAGAWGRSESAICFAATGELLNGQHRLHAVIKSGVTVRMLVMTGLAVGDQAVMDMGAKRIAGDVLALDGEINALALAAALRWCKALEDGAVNRMDAAPKYTTAELRTFLHDHPEIRYSVALADANRRRILALPSAISTTHWWISQAHPHGDDRVDLFFDKLATRVEEPHGSAVLAVDARLREMNREARKRSLPPVFISLLVRGWNHWVQGSAVAALPVHTGRLFRLPDVIAFGSSSARRPRHHSGAR